MRGPIAPSNTPDYFVWRPPGKRVAVHFRKSVMKHIEQQVRSGFTAFSTSGGEPGGLLLGTKAVLPDGPAIIVEAAEPIRCEHAPGHQFCLSDEDHRVLSAQMDRLKAEGVVVVGLYRSQAHGDAERGAAVTPGDRELLQRLLPGVASVFLLVRPVGGSDSLADIFFWHEGRVARESAFVPFPFADAMPVAPPEPAERSQRRLRIDVDAEGRDVRSIKGGHAGKSLRWSLTIIFGVLGAFAGYAVVSQIWTLSTLPVSLGLEARRSQQTWIFRWNPDVASRDGAMRGSVTIFDGQQRTMYSLNSEQLRSGEFLYTPVSATVSFTIEAVGDNGPVASESVLAIDPALERPPESK